MSLERNPERAIWESGMKAAKENNRQGIREYLSYVDILGGVPRDNQKMMDAVNQADSDGNTLLHYMAINGMNEAAYEIIANYRADPFIKAKNGDSPLDIAARRGNELFVEFAQEAIKQVEEDGYKGPDASKSWQQQFNERSKSKPKPQEQAPTPTNVGTAAVASHKPVEPTTALPRQTTATAKTSPVENSPSEQDKQKLLAEFEKQSKKFWTPTMTTFVKDIVSFLNPLAKKDALSKSDVRYKELYLEVTKLSKNGDAQAKYLLAKDYERSEDYLNKSSDQWEDDAKAKVLRRDSAAAGYGPAMLDFALADINTAKNAVAAAQKDRAKHKDSPSFDVQDTARSQLSSLADQFIKIMALPANPTNDQVKNKAEKVIRSFPALEIAIKTKQAEVPPPVLESKVRIK